MLAMHELGIPLAQVFVDKSSGKDFDRPAYKELTGRLSHGDLLYIKSIDRLGRDYGEIQNQWRVLTKERGVDIAVIDTPLLDTKSDKDLVATFLADVVLQTMSFVAQNEREDIRKRQAEGIKAAQARGVHMGRPAIRLHPEFFVLAKRWESGELTTSDLVRHTGMKETTLYRRLREHSISRAKQRPAKR